MSSLFRTTTTEKIVSPIPHGITPAQVLAYVVDLERYSRLSPFVQTVEPLSPVPDALRPTQDEAEHVYSEALAGVDVGAGNPWRACSMSEKVPLYKTIQFTMATRPAQQGLVTVVHAPQNVRMLVRLGVSTFADGSSALEEECVFHVNALASWFVTYNFRKAHESMHARLFAELQQEANTATEASAGQPVQTPAHAPAQAPAEAPAEQPKTEQQAVAAQ